MIFNFKEKESEVEGKKGRLSGQKEARWGADIKSGQKENTKHFK